jgi:hypothetical protein
MGDVDNDPSLVLSTKVLPITLPIPNIIQVTYNKYDLKRAAVFSFNTF